MPSGNYWSATLTLGRCMPLSQCWRRRLPNSGHWRMWSSTFPLIPRPSCCPLSRKRKRISAWPPPSLQMGSWSRVDVARPRTSGKKKTITSYVIIQCGSTCIIDVACLTLLLTSSQAAASDGDVYTVHLLNSKKGRYWASERIMATAFVWSRMLVATIVARPDADLPSFNSQQSPTVICS